MKIKLLLFPLLISAIVSCDKEDELQKVEVDFIASKNIITVGEEVTYTDQSIGKHDSWEWYFEGGSPEYSNEESPKVIYDSPGRYSVQLKTGNKTYYDSKFVPDLINVLGDLKAGFSVNDSIVTQGELVEFYDTSSGTPNIWNWDIYCEETVSFYEQNLTFEFLKSGIHNVTLNVQNEASAEFSSFENKIYVIPTDGLISHYNFDNNLNDIGSDTYNTSYSGKIKYSKNRHDDFCSAIELNGIDNSLELDAGSGNGIRTVSLWFNPLNSINQELMDFVALIARENGIYNNNEFNLSFQPAKMENSGSLRFNITEKLDEEYSVYSDNNSWEQGKWYHIIATVSETNGMCLYIDGVKQSNTNTYNKSTGVSGDITSIGKWGDLNMRYFNGGIDDVRFYERALTEEEIITLFYE